MFKEVVVGALLAFGIQSAALADATIPTKDIAGAKDNPLIKRYEESFIVSYQRESFTDFKVPLSALELTDRRDGMNNKLYLPKKEMEDAAGLSHSGRTLSA
jgi:OmpA-OmpF porin, OOP family